MRCASMTDASVMLTGESGVGKRFAANMIHQLSQRRRAPFVAINAADVLGHRLHLPRGMRPTRSAAAFFKPRTTARCSFRTSRRCRRPRSHSCWRFMDRATTVERHVRLMTATDHSPVQAGQDRPVPRRFVLPVERDPFHHSAASGKARGHPADVSPLLVVAHADRGAPAVERCAPAGSMEYAWPGKFSELRTVTSS